MTALACAIAACSPAAYRAKALNDQQTEAERPVIAPYVGHAYYTVHTAGLNVCDRPDFWGYDSPGCARATGRFTIDRYVSTEPNLYDAEIRVHVTFDSGVAGYAGFPASKPLTSNFADHDIRFDPIAYPVFLIHLKLTDAEALRRLELGGVVFAMSPEQVLASAWGAPISKQTDVETDSERDGRGRRGKAVKLPREVWTYPEGGRLTFIEGKLREILRRS